MLDSLSAARDAGYVRGLIVGGIVFALVSAAFTATVLSWFMLRARRPDPEYTADPSRRHRIEGGR